MDVLEHLYTRFQEFSQVKVSSSNLPSTNTKQGLFWPLTEPIDCATVNKRRELSYTRSKDFSKRAHSDDHMNVLLYTANVTSEHVHLRNLNVLLHANNLSDLEDGLIVFNFIEIGYISRVQDVIDIFKHLLVDDLGVNKEEGCLLIFNTSLH
jgi:hypothetical protein